MAWWDKLERGSKGAITVVSLLVGLLGGAFALGAATSGTVGDFRDIPDRVTEVEARLILHDSAIARINRVDSLSTKNRALLDSLSSDMRDVRCILTAGVKNTDPTLCLSTYRGNREP